MRKLLKLFGSAAIVAMLMLALLLPSHLVQADTYPLCEVVDADFNKDGVVNDSDFWILDDAYYLHGDANGDGNINALDITKTERIIAEVDEKTPGADADVDHDIDNADVTKIERIIGGLDDPEYGTYSRECDLDFDDDVDYADFEYFDKVHGDSLSTIRAAVKTGSYETLTPMISFCDEIGNWGGGGKAVELDTETKYAGTGSIKQDVTSPVKYFCYSMVWTDTESQNLMASSWDYLQFRHRCSLASTSFLQSRVFLCEDIGKYYRWDYTYAANTWELISLDMDSPDYVTDPAPDLDKITFISIEHTPDDPPAAFTAWVDNLTPGQTALLSSCDSANVSDFVGSDAGGGDGWISVHLHPYSEESPVYICGHFAMETERASYRTLGYGCLLYAKSNSHAFNVIWKGGDWTDLSNWAVIEPDDGQVFSDASDVPEAGYQAVQIYLPNYTSNGEVYCHTLTVDYGEATVAYGQQNLKYIYSSGCEESPPAVYDKDLGYNDD